MNGNKNSEERYAYFGRLDLLVINKKWAVKTVHLKIYRLGVNEHLKEKKQFNQENKPHSLTLSYVTANNVVVRISRHK